MNEVDRLAWTLIHFVWQGALVAALYAVARQCMARRAGPNARYLLAWAALALMSVAPLLTWVALRPAAPVAAIHAEVVLASPPAAPAMTAAGLPAPAAAMGRELVPPALLPWIAILWSAGALFFWMRLAMGWLWAARLRAACVNPAPGEWQAKFARLRARLQVARPVQLLISARVTAPAVVGWLRPVVLAPACAFTGLAPDQMEAVLLHELAHIRRHDYLINLWQNAVEALLFYHPAVWWVSGHMRAEREFCCDDLAVAASGDALSYARALAELEAARPRRPELAVAANGGSLLRRIARLLGPSHAGSPAGPGLAAPVMLAGAMLLCLAGFHGWGQAAPAHPTPAVKLDAVSIRPNRSGRYMSIKHDPGRITLVNVDLKTLIQTAFDLKPYQVVGPASLTSGQYDVTATFSIPPPQAGPSAPAAPSGTKLRRIESSKLQPWLITQFKLKSHHETRDLPAYALVVAQGGAKLTPTDQCGSATVGGNANLVDLESHDTVKNFATVLGFNLDRGIAVDETGITGCYDIKLEYARPLVNSTVVPENPAPSIYAALAQIGLKLESRKVPTDVLVIDHANRVPLGN